MIKNKYIISTLVLSLLCMNKTYAVCTEQAREEFEKIEDQYKIIPEFNKQKKTYKLTIERAQPHNYDYNFYIDYTYMCHDISETIMECYGIKPGEYEVNIVGQTNKCNEIIKKQTLELLRYNEFFDDPLCEGIEEFVLCQEMYNKELDYETFVSRVNSYKKKKQEKNNTENELNKTPKPTAIQKIKKNIEENLIQIIIIMVFVILLTSSILVAIKFIKQRRRLE